MRVLSLMVLVGLGAGMQLPPEPRVLQVSRHDGIVEFESPVDLPWEDLARAALPDSEFSRPDRALLQKYYREPSGTQVPFRAPLPAAVPRGQYVGLSMNGSASIQLEDIAGTVSFDTRPQTWVVSGRTVRPGSLRGVAAPASAGPVLFVLWSSQLPALSMRTATALVAGASLRVTAARASGPQTWLVGAEQGWDITRPRVVTARVYVDGTTGLTYLLVSADMGDLPCPGLAVLYDVTNDLRLIGRRATCDV